MTLLEVAYGIVEGVIALGLLGCVGFFIFMIFVIASGIRP